jgi:hypothetical protein
MYASIRDKVSDGPGTLLQSLGEGLEISNQIIRRGRPIAGLKTITAERIIVLIKFVDRRFV